MKLVATAVAVASSCLLAATSFAHGTPIDLSFFGNFPSRTATCQRVISTTAAACASKVVRRAVATALGTSAPRSTTNLDVAAATARISRYCGSDELSLLHFASIDDVLRDLQLTCDDIEQATVSALAAPEMNSPGRNCRVRYARTMSSTLRSAIQQYRRGFDRMLGRNMPPSEKHNWLTATQLRAAAVRQKAQLAMDGDCGPDDAGGDRAKRLAALQARANCLASFTYIQNAVTCPTPTCGNGVLESPEACDDGNRIDNDGCESSCARTTCDHFPSTWALLQRAIFEKHGCTNDLCHGAAKQGGLDLTAANAHRQLFQQPAQIAPLMARVYPGDERLSLLYLKLATATLGVPAANELPGSPMPVGLPALSTDELAALRLWIRGGAPAEGVVAGTASLLDACLPPPDPEKLPEPTPPPAGSGVLLPMPPLPMPAHSESEVCIASYVDLTAPGSVDPNALVDCRGIYRGTNDHGDLAGKCVAFDSQHIVQDGAMHHMIQYFYIGDRDVDDPGWGPWTCQAGDRLGQICDPKDRTACPGSFCGGRIGPGRPCAGPSFGPSNFELGNHGWFSAFGAEPAITKTFPPGVFGVLPLKGVVIWNTHAFNTTAQSTNVHSWTAYRFTSNLQYPVTYIFNTDFIYTQDVPAFESREYCATQTFPEGAVAFHLTSHTHRHGKRFRMWRAPQTPCGDSGPHPTRGSFTSPDCRPGSPEALFYESNTYNEPLQYEPQPPMVLSGSVEQRTIKFCSLYDNGATNPDEVKRASTSPLPEPVTEPGGPCGPEERRCLGGPQRGALCHGNDGNCPQSVCDACPLRGGVTSEDEMLGIQVFMYFPNGEPN